MPEQQPPSDISAPCPCRPWVEQELGRLRDDLADQLRTRRIQVGGDDEPHIVIATRPGIAEIDVFSGEGRPTVGLVASTDESGDLAGVSLTRGGEVVASLQVTEAAASPPQCRLVFDEPPGASYWLVVDRHGMHVES
jgi:hypothetical protein